MKPLAELIKSVEREIGLRKSVYPKRVREKAMTPEKAAHEIECMEDVKRLLEFKGEQELGL